MRTILATLLIAGALMVGVTTWKAVEARIADDVYQEPWQTEAVMAQMEEQDQYLQVDARFA